MHTPVSLNHKYIQEIVPTSPFNFDATFHKPDHFPSADNAWQPGQRWQTMVWQGQPLGLLFSDRGRVDNPLIELSIFTLTPVDKPFLNSVVKEVNYRYNLQLDLTEFNQLFLDDPLFGSIIRNWVGMRPIGNASLYEYLVITIVLQNATVRRSVNMLQSLFENYGTLITFDDRELYSFWQPDIIHQTPEQDLRDLKIGYRAKSLKRVSQAFVEGKIDELSLRERSREEQRSALLDLYGVGPASVGYILTDIFHQHDYLEMISPWEQKIYSKLFFDLDIENPMPVDRLIEYFTHHFKGYRALAVHYIWEDLFWKRKNEEVEWLEKLIRL